MSAISCQETSGPETRYSAPLWTFFSEARFSECKDFHINPFTPARSSAFSCNRSGPSTYVGWKEIVWNPGLCCLTQFLYPWWARIFEAWYLRKWPVNPSGKGAVRSTGRTSPVLSDETFDQLMAQTTEFASEYIPMMVRRGSSEAANGTRDNTDDIMSTFLIVLYANAASRMASVAFTAGST